MISYTPVVVHHNTKGLPELAMANVGRMSVCAWQYVGVVGIEQPDQLSSCIVFTDQASPADN